MKYYLICIMLFLCLSCKEYGDYPECFSEKDKITFNLLLNNFENHLKERYKENDLNVLYKTYLEDLSKSKIDEYFLLSDRTVNVLYGLTDEEFVEIWVLPLEDGTFFDDTNPNLNPNDFKWSIFYTINPKEKFYTCGIKNSTNKEVISFFDKTFKIGDVNYELLSSAFLEVIKNEEITNDYLLRLIVAVKFYYELSLYYSSIEIREDDGNVP